LKTASMLMAIICNLLVAYSRKKFGDPIRPPMSFPRKRESKEPRRVKAGSVWIPAFAGMTTYLEIDDVTSLA
jgi:hypothetical protein